MKLLLKILIKYYLNKSVNREIVKMSPEEEYERYLFSSPTDVLNLIKSNITINTLRHFEANTEQERMMVKGAALWLQIMKDKHLKAMAISGKYRGDKKKQLEMWKKI